MNRKCILIFSQLIVSLALFSCDVKVNISIKSSSEKRVLQTEEYQQVDNATWPTDTKTYRIKPVQAIDDEVTVYNVKYDTNEYLAFPTDLTIKKTDYCFTYETVALYYQAFRCAPPNYLTKDSGKTFGAGSDYRFVSTYTYGNYTKPDKYTDSLGVFNNKKGKYLEFDIALSDSYSSKNRGAGRVVVVVDGIEDYGDDPVCYFTIDHYANFSEFYNYATGWGEKFLGAYQTSSPRKIPTTVECVF